MIPWLDNQHIHAFPSTSDALDTPDGLLAAGGDLSLERLLTAYRSGIFPWYSPNEPILWWSPSQRMIIHPADIHVSRSMRRFLQKKLFDFRINNAFEQVIRACAEARQPDSGTWIDESMIEAYINLHQHGYATSVECWQNNILVGGVYGVHLGKVYFGESMFSRCTNASKAALIYACQTLDIALLDCQFHTAHLESMGGTLINRTMFLQKLEQYLPSVQ